MWIFPYKPIIFGYPHFWKPPSVPRSKHGIRLMLIHPTTGIQKSWYLNPYQWLDDHPLLWETKPCFDHRTYHTMDFFFQNVRKKSKIFQVYLHIWNFSVVTRLQCLIFQIWLHGNSTIFWSMSFPC